MHPRKRKIATLTLTLCLFLSNAAGAVVKSAGLDLNRDGVIQLTDHPRIPVDQTSSQRPFVFWVNEDQDDVETYETWPVQRPDHSTPTIDSIRDIEDLYPLWIAVGEAQISAQATLEFTWGASVEGTPAVNFFRSADHSCTNQQLVSTDIANTQLSEPFGHSLGTASFENPLKILADKLGAPSQTAHGRGYCLLLEGAAVGAGRLLAELANGPGSTISKASIHMALRPVKSLYQRTRIDWPEHIGPPWTYQTEQPPDPQLQWREDPQGVEFQPPWYEDNHVMVWVYGWQTEGETGYLSATVKGGETIFKRLWHRGYRGRLVFLHWPTVKPRLAYGLFHSEYRAYKAGGALKDLVESQPPGRMVHVTAHSLGNVVLMEALKLGMQAEDAMFQVGALPAGAVNPRDDLILTEVRDLATPAFAEEFGYRGYLSASKTRLYNMYNPFDHTWIGWNLAPHLIKPTHEHSARYEYRPQAEPELRYVLKYRPDGELHWLTRPVTDPHEIMAFIARSKTHPVGGEARLKKPILHSFDIGRPPYSFGHGHTVGWSWTPQRTLDFYNLLLDAFNIAHKSPLR